ncbi:hypothetical protein [Tautonia marina]|uniref:hypothetical protein n=1 Tax=Tautonia marina TaxID=2653855 RepID=UPI0012611B60|nr:hypothetical protein [Tautonia marina]
MRDFAFYNAGIDDAKGPKRVLGLARRLVRRLLRPMFFHQEALYRDLQTQIDHLTGQVEALSQRSAAADAFRWDAVAMARRLASIEDHLARIQTPDAAGRAVPAPGCRVDTANNLSAPHVSTFKEYSNRRISENSSVDDGRSM